MSNLPQQSPRAQFVEQRTYLRPREDGGVELETPDQALDRQINHQRFLWENAKKDKFEHLKGTPEFDQRWPLTADEEAELAELRSLLASRKAILSGRVRWMADTDVIRERASAAFNCSFTEIKLPADLTDAFWLLLQGCGVGFRPVVGMLTGFGKKIDEIEFIASTREDRDGGDDNRETFDPDTKTWTIVVGDSAKAWAKLIGKITAGKYQADKLVIDFSQLRPAGQRLRGYGWISSGWEPLRDGLKIITNVLNNKAGKSLDAVDILDIMNALGTVLSSRRSAQIGLLDADHIDVEAFKKAKDGEYYKTSPWRGQSNNSLTFLRKPTRDELVTMFDSIMASGDPGFYNLAAARKRAPWAEGTNPCAEIILPNKGFCNLVNIIPHRFDSLAELERAFYIMSRANYRQTCVSMKDGVLQLAWDDNNRLLRLCGVSLTGYVQWSLADNPFYLREANRWSREGADSMADELGTPRAALVTQVQPSGTGSKSVGHVGDEVKEGAHNSLAEFILNWIGTNKLDPLVEKARAANYRVINHPTDPSAVLIAWPVQFDRGGLSPVKKTRTVSVYDFDKDEITTESSEEELWVNLEPAIDQLERYRVLMENFIDHNCSITIYYDPEEVPAIIDWFDENWDDFVGVSFLMRGDPTKTAADYGQPYLPQEPMFEKDYWEYVKRLKPIDWSDDTNYDGIDDMSCATGACPVR